MPNIKFFNNCSRTILLIINSETKLTILPYQSNSVAVNASDLLEILVRQEDESCLKKSFIKSRYFLTIETKYVYENVCEEVCFEMCREKVRISGDAYYERIFLTSKTIFPIAEKNFVSNKEEIKKTYRKNFIYYSLLVSPFEHLTGLCIAFLIVGIVLTYKLGWVPAIIYFMCAYLFVQILNYFIDKFCNCFFYKTLGVKDEKTEFYNILKDEYASNYYNDSFRKAYLNDIEIDRGKF